MMDIKFLRPGVRLGDSGIAPTLAQEFYEGSSKHLQKAKDRLRRRSQEIYG